MLDINPDHLAVLKIILKKILPDNTNVWVFGSRASGTAKKFSDLDLLIDANGKCLPTHLLADLRESFEESELPYKVDIIDWNSITDDFRNNIIHQRVLLKFND